MDFETALDELYGAAPEDFVAERARLAKALKADGGGVEAERLAKLRKPSLAAWVLNRLVRDERRDVDLLLHSGHRLRTARDRDAFDQARGAEREAIDRLTGEAAELLRQRGSVSDAVLKQVADSLRAAAVSEEGRELLARGRFTQALESAGFDVPSALAPAAPARRRPAKQADPDKQRKAKAELADAKAQLRAAERAARAAEAEVETARRRVAAAEARLRRF